MTKRGQRKRGQQRRPRIQPNPAKSSRQDATKNPQDHRSDGKTATLPKEAKTDKRSRALERILTLPERPGRVMAGLLFLAIIVFGNLAAPAIADPASAPRPWSYLTDGLCVAVVFGATSTLTTLAYCLIVFRDVEPTTNFLKWVAQNAGIGAVLGTLLGCRMALPLVEAAKRPGGQSLSFVGFLGIVSNTATMLTLLMIAACWWRLAGLVKEISSANAERATRPRWAVPRWAKTAGLRFVTLILSNLGGVLAAQAVWMMLN
jgi:hypothetical protein